MSRRIRGSKLTPKEGEGTEQEGVRNCPTKLGRNRGKSKQEGEKEMLGVGRTR